jgi:hypothetical protein
MDNLFKKALLVLSPTKDKSPIWSHKGRRLYFNQANFNDIDDEIRYHLIIISNNDDDKILVNNWIYHLDTGEILRAEYDGSLLSKRFKKILAATDTSLFSIEDCPVRGSASNVKYILPTIEEEFIEQVVDSHNNGEIITDLLVEYVLDKIEMACTCTSHFESMNCPHSYFDNDTEECCHKRFPNGEYWDKTFKPKVDSKNNTITIMKIDISKN